MKFAVHICNFWRKNIVRFTDNCCSYLKQNSARYRRHLKRNKRYCLRNFISVQKSEILKNGEEAGNFGCLCCNTVWSDMQLPTSGRTNCLHFQSCRWRQYVPPKRWCIPSSPHGITIPNIIIGISILFTSFINDKVLDACAVSLAAAGIQIHARGDLLHPSPNCTCQGHSSILQRRNTNSGAQASEDNPELAAEQNK